VGDVIVHGFAGGFSAACRLDAAEVRSMDRYSAKE
jgi:hypothetical protein